MPSLAASPPVHAPVEWAQRKDLLYITVRMEDAKCSKVDITDDKLSICGTGGPDKASFECNIEFNKPIDSSKVRRCLLDRGLEFVIPKKESGPFWPRLLKESTKQHWLKVDFNKWKDEDDESDHENAWDMNDMMSKMGGMPGGGMPGGGRSDYDFEDDNDSENAELPDLEDDKEDEEGNEFNDAAEDKTSKGDAAEDGKKSKPADVKTPSSPSTGTAS